MPIEPDATSRQGEKAGPLRLHRASDGYELVYRVWSPEEGNPCGRILALHGIQSHGGWYEASCRQLAEAGFEVWFPDRRGSGRNQQNRGDVPAMERWFDDLDELIDVMSHDDGQHSDREPVPRFLLGLSWGAKLAVAHAFVRPHNWQGLILLYPGIHTHVRVKGWQRLAIDLLFTLGMKRTRITIPLGDPELFTRSREAQQMIERDQLALHQVTISFLHATGRLDRLAQQAPSQLELPLFCQLAGADEIVDNEATRTFLGEFARCGLTVKEYPAARHTLEFEPNREQITGDLIEWLEELLLRNR